MLSLHMLLSSAALLLTECLIGGNAFHLVSHVRGLAVSHLCEVIIFIFIHDYMKVVCTKTVLKTLFLLISERYNSSI